MLDITWMVVACMGIRRDLPESIISCKALFRKEETPVFTSLSCCSWSVSDLFVSPFRRLLFSIV